MLLHWYLTLRHLLPLHHRMFTKFIARLLLTSLQREAEETTYTDSSTSPCQ